MYTHGRLNSSVPLYFGQESPTHTQSRLNALVAGAVLVADPDFPVARVVQLAFGAAPALVSELRRHIRGAPRVAVLVAHLTGGGGGGMGEGGGGGDTVVFAVVW